MTLVFRRGIKTALFPPRSSTVRTSAHSSWIIRVNLLQARHKGRGKTWKPDEDKILTEMRTVGKPWEEIHSRLPERTLRAVTQRWNIITPRSPDGRLLKYWGPKSKRYSAEDDEKVLKLVKSGIRPTKLEDIAQSLPERDPGSISYHYFSALHPKRHGRWITTKKQARWTKQETALLLDLRNTERLEYSEIAARLGRTAEGVRTRYIRTVRSISETPEYPTSRWFFTAEEDTRIVELRKQGRTTEEIAAQFPKRTTRAVERRVWLLRERTGAPRWRSGFERAELEEELVRLRDEENVSWKEIMRIFPGTPLQTLQSYLSIARRKRKTKSSAAT